MPPNPSERTFNLAAEHRSNRCGEMSKERKRREQVSDHLDFRVTCARSYQNFDFTSICLREFVILRFAIHIEHMLSSMPSCFCGRSFANFYCPKSLSRPDVFVSIRILKNVFSTRNGFSTRRRSSRWCGEIVRI